MLGGQTRWRLLPPSEEVTPLTEFKGEPLPVLQHITRRIRVQDGVYTIDAALWKQCDGYFQGTRYDPAGITDYNAAPDPNFSVDEQALPDPVQDPDGEWRTKYCAPDPGNDPPGNEAACALPQYESEKVEVVVLERLQTVEPAQELAPGEEVAPKPVIRDRRAKS